ncbi:MAG: pyroglutamyl-peptidase I [Ramlibacter sp.]
MLLTGFEPFDGERVNPSWEAVRALDGRQLAGHRIVAAQLPTVFDQSLAVLRQLLHTHRPALVLCSGQAGGRPAISLERVAINVNDARIPDNAQAQPIDTPVIAGGPAAYFSSLPIKAMLAALEREGLRAEVSQTAGTFVCNHVFYGLMHELAGNAEFAGVRAGLIHVPWLPGQGQPSMAVADVVRGLEIALQCALTTATDIRRQAGAIS